MIWIILHVLFVTTLVLRLLWRDNLRADVRMAWFVILIFMPVVGYVLYFLFGEARIDRRSREKHDQTFTRLRTRAAAYFAEQTPPPVPASVRGAFQYASSINGFRVLSGNQGTLLPEEQARDALLRDVASAHRSVEILYYIWLTDETGRRLARALSQVASRGVRCRVMVDALGSRAFIHSPYWQEMKEAGVEVEVVLPFRNALRTLLRRRIDLRNHRKITIIDDRIVYCGSQNCADAAFAVKAKYAPWVDIVLRLTGPVVAQSKMLFASDWLAYRDEALELFLPPHKTPSSEGFPAVVIGAGPTERAQATPQLLLSLIASARRQLIISTPYFVPDALVLNALCAAALRGVKVVLIFPHRNDSRIVAAVSRSHYAQLLEAGAHIFEYLPGLLHAKTLTLDGHTTLIGSTNLDLRSFDLNYENNILLNDTALTEAIIARQNDYLRQSRPVTRAEIAERSLLRRMWQNALSTFSPVL